MTISTGTSNSNQHHTPLPITPAQQQFDAAVRSYDLHETESALGDNWDPYLRDAVDQYGRMLSGLRASVSLLSPGDVEQVAYCLCEIARDARIRLLPYEQRKAGIMLHLNAWHRETIDLLNGASLDSQTRSNVDIYSKHIGNRVTEYTAELCKDFGSVENAEWYREVTRAIGRSPMASNRSAIVDGLLAVAAQSGQLGATIVRSEETTIAGPDGRKCVITDWPKNELLRACIRELAERGRRLDSTLDGNVGLYDLPHGDHVLEVSYSQASGKNGFTIVNKTDLAVAIVVTA